MNPNPALVNFFFIPAANIINILMPFYPVTRNKNYYFKTKKSITIV